MFHKFKALSELLLFFLFQADTDKFQIIAYAHGDSVETLYFNKHRYI